MKVLHELRFIKAWATIATLSRHSLILRETQLFAILKVSILEERSIFVCMWRHHVKRAAIILIRYTKV